MHLLVLSYLELVVVLVDLVPQHYELQQLVGLVETVLVAVPAAEVVLVAVLVVVAAQHCLADSSLYLLVLVVALDSLRLVVPEPLVVGLLDLSRPYLQPLAVRLVAFVEQLVSAVGVVFAEQLASAVEAVFAFVVLLVHFVAAVRSLVRFGHFEHLAVVADYYH